MIDGTTSLYGIIGQPVRHSLGPVMHNTAFTALGMNSVYVPMECADGADAVHALATLGFCGVSVTVPHKESVMAALDEIDPVARKIGAVNTLLFRTDPTSNRVISRGFNTDWIGSNLALAEKITLAECRAIIFGAGGAARAVGYGLVEAGAEVVFVNRTEQKARELANSLGCSSCGIEQLADLHGDVFINTSTLGMGSLAGISPLPATSLRYYRVVMDIVYSPLATRLLTEAANAGCQVIDGLAMLLYQGAVQLKIWTGQQAPLAVMREALEKALAAKEAS